MIDLGDCLVNGLSDLYGKPGLLLFVGFRHGRNNLLLLLDFFFKSRPCDNNLFCTFKGRRVYLDDVPLFDYGIWLVGLLQYLLELVVGYDGQLVHFVVTGAPAVRKTQTPADGLFRQGLRGRSSERDYGVKVCNVPSLFEHIHMDYDLHPVVRVFKRKQLLDVFLLLLAPLIGVYLHHLIGISPLKKGLRLYKRLYL